MAYQHNWVYCSLLYHLPNDDEEEIVGCPLPEEEHKYMPLKPEGYVVNKRGIVSKISDDETETEDENEVIDLITSDEE